MRFKHKMDWDLNKLSADELEQLTLPELQRIINKRWANGLEALQERAEKELARRNPLANWSCKACNKPKYHEKEMRVAGGFLASFLGWETEKYHAVICNYCGKTEFYNVQMSSSEKGLGLFGG